MRLVWRKRKVTDWRVRPRTDKFALHRFRDSKWKNKNRLQTGSFKQLFYIKSFKSYRIQSSFTNNFEAKEQQLQHGCRGISEMCQQEYMLSV